jgi:hypothetical protein
VGLDQCLDLLLCFLGRLAALLGRKIEQRIDRLPQQASAQRVRRTRRGFNWAPDEIRQRVHEQAERLVAKLRDRALAADPHRHDHRRDIL